MQFPGRALLVAFVVGLLVVPLQMALIPLLKLHMHIGIGKGFLGVWLAHTGFGLPLAIYLLRNYMIGLPKDIIENARIDGASDFKIFMKLILPLSFPALAAFSIFQFLWTWNDLLVAKVFLLDSSGQTEVMTAKLVELLGGVPSGLASAHTYQSFFGLVWSVRLSLNHACWSDVCDSTKSTIMRKPRLCASANMVSKSSIVPNMGSMAQ